MSETGSTFFNVLPKTVEDVCPEIPTEAKKFLHFFGPSHAGNKQCLIQRNIGDWFQNCGYDYSILLGMKAIFWVYFDVFKFLRV